MLSAPDSARFGDLVLYIIISHLGLPAPRANRTITQPESRSSCHTGGHHRRIELTARLIPVSMPAMCEYWPHLHSCPPGRYSPAEPVNIRKHIAILQSSPLCPKTIDVPPTTVDARRLRKWCFAHLLSWRYDSLLLRSEKNRRERPDYHQTPVLMSTS